MPAPNAAQVLDPFGAFALFEGFQRALTELTLENSRRNLEWQTKMIAASAPFVWSVTPPLASDAKKVSPAKPAKRKATPKPAAKTAPLEAVKTSPVEEAVAAPVAPAPKAPAKAARSEVTLAPTPDWAPVAEAPVASEASPAPKPAPAAKKAPAKPKAAPKPKAPVTPDDLTALKGVGPKLAKELDALGVTTYAQIASWSAKDIDGFEAKLSGVPGRITRDAWVDQAKALVKG